MLKPSSYLVSQIILLALLVCPLSTPVAQQSDAETPDSSQRWTDFGWIGDEAPELKPLESVAQAPGGYTRVEVAEGSFAAWLRNLPIRTDRAHVLSHANRRLNSPSRFVVYLDISRVQECADSAIRLHAEWLWSRGKIHDIGYHFTSGDLSTYEDWVAGERFRVAGSSVERVKGAARGHSRSSLSSYFTRLFTYAGTRSLRLDSDPVAAKDARAGDFFVAPGSPGHAVMILDIVENEDGERRALIGQGFMPAQDFHVVKDSRRALDDVWFTLPSSANDTIKTPSWKAFSGKDLRRFRDRQ